MHVFSLTIIITFLDECGTNYIRYFKNTKSFEPNLVEILLFRFHPILKKKKTGKTFKNCSTFQEH